jgi:phosphate transport system permease protein
MSDRDPSAGLGMRHALGVAFEYACLGATVLCVLVLVFLLGATLVLGLPAINWTFLTSPMSQNPADAGIFIALVDSFLLMLLTAAFAIPVGIATAVYLEEYAGQGWWVQLIRINIANLSGVPSVVYGILGFALFASWLNLGSSLLAGALTLSLVILPVVIIASQEALRAVPSSLRNASYALGATRWQTIWHQVLPSAMPGIMTGVILALSRAIGEAAPIMLLAVGTIFWLPEHPLDSFTALPLQIVLWTTHQNLGFQPLAAGAIIVLMTLLVLMNAGAIYIRYHFSQSERV